MKTSCRLLAPTGNPLGLGELCCGEARRTIHYILAQKHTLVQKSPSTNEISNLTSIDISNFPLPSQSTFIASFSHITAMSAPLAPSVSSQPNDDLNSIGRKSTSGRPKPPSAQLRLQQDTPGKGKRQKTTPLPVPSALRPATAQFPTRPIPLNTHQPGWSPIQAYNDPISDGHEYLEDSYQDADTLPPGTGLPDPGYGGYAHAEWWQCELEPENECQGWPPGYTLTSKGGRRPKDGNRRTDV
jgi:hypothetical protein